MIEETIQRDRGGVGARFAFWLAWSLAALCVAVYVAGIPLWVLARSADVPGGWGADLSVFGLVAGVLYLSFTFSGALIASRRHRNLVGWILLAVGLLWTLNGTLNYYVIYGVAVPGSLPFPVTIAGLNNWLWVPFVGLLGTYVFLLFPDGKLPSGRWRPLAWLSGVVIVLVSIVVGLTPEPLQFLGDLPNPFGVSAPWVGIASIFLVPLFLFCILASVLSLVLRFWRSRGEERQQIKWIALAASAIGSLYLAAMVGSFVYPQETWFAPGSPLWLLGLEYAALLSFTLVPTAIGFAVLRYRLYEIDFIINRTLVYGSLTATLLALYLGGVATAQLLFRVFTGQEQQAQLAVVISTLAIAALFNPLRRRIQAFIDRSFYRKKYDARKILEAFSAKLREETDLDGLNANLLNVVRQTVHPAHASLWLSASDTTKKHEDPLP